MPDDLVALRRECATKALAYCCCTADHISHSKIAPACMAHSIAEQVLKRADGTLDPADDAWLDAAETETRARQRTL